MRIRRKKEARPELEACSFYIAKPEQYKGNWQNLFQNQNPIYLELGCGKGWFAAEFGANHPNINLLAIDIKSEILWYAMKKIEKAYQEKELQVNNLYIMPQNIEQILNIFNEQDKIERIYINFCNPWPRPRHKKRRLTHIRQLEQYKNFLVPNAQIHFKTDDDELFKESIQYFKNCGFQILEENWDLPLQQENIQTEHEKMFREKGIKIKKLIAQKKEF